MTHFLGFNEKLELRASATSPEARDALKRLCPELRWVASSGPGAGDASEQALLGARIALALAFPMHRPALADLVEPRADLPAPVRAPKSEETCGHCVHHRNVGAPCCFCGKEGARA